MLTLLTMLAVIAIIVFVVTVSLGLIAVSPVVLTIVLFILLDCMVFKLLFGKKNKD